MGPFKSDFLRSLSERGFIHQITDGDGLDARAQLGVISAYIGFDATADSLHIGSLVQIMLLRRLQQAGHRPIVLMGGGTTKVGDPSGRDETRQLLTEEQINANITGIRATFARFLDFGAGPSGAIMANNDDWLKDLQYIDFLRDVGRHFTINRMLTMDSVKLRLEREQPVDDVHRRAVGLFVEDELPEVVAVRERALAVELEGRRAAHNLEARHLGQSVEHLFRYTLGEVLLILLLTHVGER